jgi:site-specific recombinase
MSVMNGGDGRSKFTTNEYVVDRQVANTPAPRFGVTYDDISTREEREYWIAGSSLKVIDLETKEVIAERIGYMVDVFQGSKAGARSPWLLAADHACPSFQRNSVRPPVHSSVSQLRQTQRFVEKVLRPKN